MVQCNTTNDKIFSNIYNNMDISEWRHDTLFETFKCNETSTLIFEVGAIQNSNRENVLTTQENLNTINY